jgi:hypothetical protein
MDRTPHRWWMPATLALLLAGGPVLAQEAPQTAIPDPALAAEQDVSAKEAEQFAEAISALKDTQTDADQKLEGVEDPAEMARIREEADREMRWAIEETGLTVQRYQQILVAYQQNPTVQQEVMKHYRGE